MLSIKYLPADETPILPLYRTVVLAIAVAMRLDPDPL